MIFNEWMEPQGLAPDAGPIADYKSTGQMKADARNGSARLRDAILRMHGQRVNNRPKRAYGGYGNWVERKSKFDEIRRVQKLVAQHFGIAPEVMTGWRGRRDISEKRQVAMYLAREIVGSSYPDIARCFGGKDHTTVMYACDAVSRRAYLENDLKALREKIAA